MARPQLIRILMLVAIALLLCNHHLGKNATGAVVAVCGNDEIEGDEACDGISDFDCPDHCTADCRCPPAEARALTVSSRHTAAYDVIDAKKANTINLNLSDIGFQAVTFVFNQTAEDVRLYVDANISWSGSTYPDGTVYQYFNLFLQNNSQKQYLSFVQVFFKVPVAWTIANNIRDISLQKQVQYEPWSKIASTAKLSQDSMHAYFVAQPNELGAYAIVGHKMSAVTISHTICGNKLLESGETSENCCADAGCSLGLSCVANKCQEIAMCGNNRCESTENAKACPLDCAKKAFTPVMGPLLMLLTAAMAAAILFFGKKAFKKLKAKRRAHVTPERWF